jgi:ABC-2 type transport system permease protein
MNSTFKTFRVVARQELRMLMADRSLLFVAGLLAVLIGYGFYNGLAQTKARDAVVATVQRAEINSAKSQLERLQGIEAGTVKPGPFDNPANPATLGGSAGRKAILHNIPLAPVAIGQSDMMANYYGIGMGSKVEFMYDSEIESPWNLLSGHFDLSFVIVFLLPLLIFALAFNLLSTERENGTERMLLSQPLGLVTLALGKLLPRAAVVLAVASLLPVLLLLGFREETRALDQVGALLGWTGIVLAYGVFWFALALAVNSLRLSSSANALILIASWTVLVLVIPVLLNLLVEQINPAPSRTQLSIQTRTIQAENLRRYDDLFSGDYRYIEEPESLQARNGRIEIPPRVMASFLARRDMDARVEKLLADFDDALVAQQSTVDGLSFVSPAIMTYEGLTRLAGTDSQRFMAFREDVSRFHDGWRKHFEPFILYLAAGADRRRDHSVGVVQSASLSRGIASQIQRLTERPRTGSSLGATGMQ